MKICVPRMKAKYIQQMRLLLSVGSSPGCYRVSSNTTTATTAADVNSSSATATAGRVTTTAPLLLV